MRVLITGTRKVFSQLNVECMRVLSELWLKHPTGLVLVHGGCLTGVDATVDNEAQYLTGTVVERHPASAFVSFKHRNQHMVDLGADKCLAFADKWASGTGQTARMARAAGIHTIDYGVDTI